MPTRTFSTLRAVAEDLQREDAGAGLDVEAAALRPDEAPLDGVLRQAADAVAAHLGLGAVGVEDAHSYRCLVGRQDEQDAVGADAEVTVAHGDGESRPVALVALRFDEDEVVAGAVHLYEAHIMLPSTPGRG